MKNNTLIISENNRPFWQLPLAALLFTLSVYIIGKNLYLFNWSNDYFKHLSEGIKSIVLLVLVAIGLCSSKRVYIDIEKSRFKKTLEVGPVKFGKWQTIKNYKYVSVFHKPLTNGSYTFVVNLWYDKNKHFELYSKDSFSGAIQMGYDLSEHLNIDLLDATIPKDFKWIDKETLKHQTNTIP